MILIAAPTTAVRWKSNRETDWSPVENWNHLVETKPIETWNQKENQAKHVRVGNSPNQVEAQQNPVKLSKTQ